MDEMKAVFCITFYTSDAPAFLAGASEGKLRVKQLQA